MNEHLSDATNAEIDQVTAACRHLTAELRAAFPVERVTRVQELLVQTRQGVDSLLHHVGANRYEAGNLDEVTGYGELHRLVDALATLFGAWAGESPGGVDSSAWHLTQALTGSDDLRPEIAERVKGGRFVR